ncbi:MAG TPA: cell division ATP-binding protein FtsE [Candidatus Binatia bacterium]|nr:cell division ATP-binding protein FtsE [Candidatus Binatia bacterium]
MIQLFHVSKIYPPNSAALRDINLQIGKKEFVFLTGPSGAGKSTLLRLLFREEEPTEGQILINGKNITRLNSGGIARLRQEIGLVFQEFKLLPRLTVLDNVAVAAEILGTPRRESQRKAYQLLRDLGLREKYDVKPPTLSGGEQQRVAIARALVNDPMLVLADEPTGNLDADMAHEIMRLFLKIREKGTTLLIATHDIDLTERYGSRIIQLQRGSMTKDSSQGKGEFKH